jgi:hypothetical protein
MDLREYQEMLLSDVKSLAESKMVSDRTQFVEKVTSMMIEIGEIPEFENSYFYHTGKRQRKILVDGYYYHAMMKELYLVVADYYGVKSDKNLTKSRIDQVSGFALNFMEYLDLIHEQAEESSLGWQFADYIENFWHSVERIKVIVISDFPLSNYVKTIDSTEFHGREVNYSVWGLQRIQEIEMSKNVNEDLELDFTDFNSQGIQAIHANIDVNDEYDAYMAIIPGNILAEIYHKHGAKLLEGNVRSFLSNRGKVNKAIKGTLLNSPNMFFAYNNGIAATAENIETEIIDNAIYIKKVKNLQIVNGGQTTASIFNAKYVEKKRSDLNNVFVPMKLSVVNPKKAEEMIPKIARTANTQNKVSKADFFSNSPFHIRIETLSKKLLAPSKEGEQFSTTWFYERARGQYNQNMLKMTQSEKKAFKRRNPKKQLITKTDLAKYYNSNMERPNLVSLGAQTNFMKFAEIISNVWEKKNIRFNQSFYKKMVSIAIIFKYLERMVSKSNWYQNAFRANIVTYSIAIFFNKLKKQYPEHTLDYEKIWKLQDVTSEMDREFQEITYKVFIELTRESEGRTRNITEWAKKEEAWKQAKANIEHKYKSTIKIDLVERKKVVSKEKDEEKEQKNINKLTVYTFVVNKGEKFWKEVLDFGMKNKAISGSEYDLLEIASKMNTTGKIPSEIQSWNIKKTYNRLKQEGLAI